MSGVFIFCRSGVVVWADDAPQGTALLFLKGAPTVIKDLVQPESVPEDFNEVRPSLLQHLWSH